MTFRDHDKPTESTGMPDSGPTPVLRRRKQPQPKGLPIESPFRAVDSVPQTVEYRLPRGPVQVPPHAYRCEDVPASWSQAYGGPEMKITIFAPPHATATPPHTRIFVETTLPAPFSTFELINPALRDLGLQWITVNPHVMWAAVQTMIHAAVSAARLASEETVAEIREGIREGHIKTKWSLRGGTHARIYARKPTIRIERNPAGYFAVIEVKQGNTTHEIAHSMHRATREEAIADGEALLKSKDVESSYQYRYKRPRLL